MLCNSEGEPELTQPSSRSEGSLAHFFQGAKGLAMAGCTPWLAHGHGQCPETRGSLLAWIVQILSSLT